MTYESTYGINETGKPYLSREGTWFRNDKWTSKRMKETFMERRFAANREDNSPVFYGQYDAQCSCCWLGFSHTTDAHNCKCGPNGGAR